MTPADAAPSERRLHPWSWLFVLLQQLRQFIFPLIAAFFFGGDRNEWALIVAGQGDTAAAGCIGSAARFPTRASTTCR